MDTILNQEYKRCIYGFIFNVHIYTSSRKIILWFTCTNKLVNYPEVCPFKDLYSCPTWGRNRCCRWDRPSSPSGSTSPHSSPTQPSLSGFPGFKVKINILTNRDIYSGHPPPPWGGGIFVQIEKQGRIWRRTRKKERKRGEKKKKSDKTHVKLTLWSLKGEFTFFYSRIGCPSIRGAKLDGS